MHTDTKWQSTNNNQRQEKKIFIFQCKISMALLVRHFDFMLAAGFSLFFPFLPLLFLCSFFFFFFTFIVVVVVFVLLFFACAVLAVAFRYYYYYSSSSSTYIYMCINCSHTDIRIIIIVVVLP